MQTIKLNFPNPSKVFNKQIYDSLEDYSKFIEVWYGGASSGKSYGVVQKVVLKALKQWKYPRKILFLRKVDRTVVDSIFSDVKNCLERWRLLDLCKINQSNHTITLPNGAQFLFKGMQDLLLEYSSAGKSLYGRGIYFGNTDSDIAGYKRDENHELVTATLKDDTILVDKENVAEIVRKSGVDLKNVDDLNYRQVVWSMAAMDAGIDGFINKKLGYVILFNRGKLVIINE